MKQSAFKSIIKDLHMAGIFDMSSINPADLSNLETSTFNKAFGIRISDSTRQEEQESLPNSKDIANEIDALFSTFDESKKVEANEDSEEKIIEIETIQADPIAKQINRKPIRKQENTQTENLKTIEIKPKKVELPDPKSFFVTQDIKDSKLLVIIPIKNETALKSSEEYTLLTNILKTMGTTVENTSIIFVNLDYKKITLQEEDYITTLVKELGNKVKSANGSFIFCFGADCFKLMQIEKERPSIRKDSKQIIDYAEDKKLLANYSLSAMLNTPKYKAVTWANILLIKDKIK